MQTAMTYPPSLRRSVDRTTRVSDRERERTADQLGQAFAQGYLSMQEYESRLDDAFAATTSGALADLMRDLPTDRIRHNDPRRRAARRAIARRSVLLHAVAYLALSLLMVAIWLAVALTAGQHYFWPIWPILGCGIGFVSHALPVWLSTRSG